jgi:UDP-N-acetylglucosamine 2-epimerase (non-hydrolysing)
MKVAPVLSALKGGKSVEQTLIHTGQRYDANMSDVFFQQLGIPAPDVNLAVGSGTHAKQTAEIMIRLEPIVLERQPDMVLVYGDVNSTVATALVWTSWAFKSATLKRDCARLIEPCRRRLTVS